MKYLLVLAAAAALLCGCGSPAPAAILVQSASGTYTLKSTLAAAATDADTAGKTIIVTTALSAVQSNISSATLHTWPTDRTLEVRRGGSINPTTKFTGLPYSRPEWFGTGNGALAKAIAASNVIELSDAVYTPDTNLSLGSHGSTTGKTLRGIPERSIIRPTSAVTVALTVGTRCNVIGVSIDGVNTTDATGIIIGPSGGVSSHTMLDNVKVETFLGGTGVGMRVANIVDATIRDPFLYGSNTNMVIEGYTTDLPTTTKVYGGYIAAAQLDGGVATAGSGAVARQSDDLVFYGTIFESNYQAGFSASPGAGQRVQLTAFHDCTFWSNWYQYEVANPRVAVAAYSLAMDGTVGVVDNVKIEDCGFYTGVTLAVNLNKVTNLRISDPMLTGEYSADILVGGSYSTGQISGVGVMASVGNTFPSSPADMISITDSAAVYQLDGLYDEWTTWTPTYAVDSATIASVTNVFSKYKIVGKTCWIQLYFTGTLSGSPGAFITATLPAGVSIGEVGTTFEMPTVIYDSVKGHGTVRVSGGNDVLYFFKGVNETDNWSAGTGRGGSVSLQFEIL